MNAPGSHTYLHALTRCIRFDAAADAVKREDEERVQQVFLAFLHPHHPAVRHTAHQLEAGSSRKRLLDAVRNRALPLPAAGGRMLSTAKKAIAMQKVTGFGSYASGFLPPQFDAPSLARLLVSGVTVLQARLLWRMTRSRKQEGVRARQRLHRHQKQAKTREEHQLTRAKEWC